MQLPTDLGPKMQACSEQERQFVWAFVQNGCEDATDAARKAGYSDPGVHSSAIRVRGHALRHRQRVIEAMQEVGRMYFGGLLLPAVLAAEDMITNPKHPDHAKMVAGVLSAHGLGTQQNINLNQTVTDNTGKAVLDRIRRAAAVLGVDPAQLLGLMPMKVINADEPQS